MKKFFGFALWFASSSHISYYSVGVVFNVNFDIYIYIYIYINEYDLDVKHKWTKNRHLPEIKMPRKYLGIN